MFNSYVKVPENNNYTSPPFPPPISPNGQICIRLLQLMTFEKPFQHIHGDVRAAGQCFLVPLGPNKPSTTYEAPEFIFVLFFQYLNMSKPSSHLEKWWNAGYFFEEQTHQVANHWRHWHSSFSLAFNWDSRSIGELKQPWGSPLKMTLCNRMIRASDNSRWYMYVIGYWAMVCFQEPWVPGVHGLPGSGKRSIASAPSWDQECPAEIDQAAP